MKIRTVAIDCRLIGQSGIGTFIENVVRHMVDRIDTEFVLFGNLDRLSAYARRANCHIVECNYPSFSLKELFCFPTKEVNNCDAFFTPFFNIPFGIRVPIFSTIHDVVFFDVKGMCSPIGKLIRRLFIQRALNISTKVFTVSNFSKSRIEALFNPSCPVVVCSSGISEELKIFRSLHSPVPPKDRKDNIVYLGNLKKHKGLHVLLAAFKQFREALPQSNTTLTIIGNIDFRTKDKKIESILQQHDDRIIFLRGASNDTVFRTLAEAKLLVSPSEYEGLGLPPMEAMFLGTPSVISDIPVYKEIYGQSPAIFFKVGDAADLAEKIIRQTPTIISDIENLVATKHNFQHISTLLFKEITNSVY
jgi:glycosyltransferase involved in cell wall biosynthesis